MPDTIINCPKCDAPMRQLDAGSFVLDRCEKCYGIWLDKGERLKILTDSSLTDGVDIGPEATGEQMDAITEINCPRCAEPMTHQADLAQKHIEFEWCRNCQGSFFDAGELRNLGSTSLTERIRAFFGG